LFFWKNKERRNCGQNELRRARTTAQCTKDYDPHLTMTCLLDDNRDYHGEMACARGTAPSMERDSSKRSVHGTGTNDWTRKIPRLHALHFLPLQTHL
jgi:hypothetical protein